MLTVAHLTDMHVQPELAAAEGLAQCLQRVQSLPVKPGLVITGGDIVMDAFDAGFDRAKTQFDLVTGVFKRECALPVRHCLGNHDIFLNVAGGVKLAEPAADLGVVAAVASSFLDRPISPKTVVFGEMGLTGEIRGINQMEIRVREAARMGFKRCVLPRTQLRGLDRAAPIELVRVGHLKDLLGEIF